MKSGEGISRIFTSFNMLDFKFKSREKIQPASLTAGEHRLRFQINQRVMISVDNQTLTSFKVAAPFLQSFDNPQLLLISGGVVKFSGREFSRVVGYKSALQKF